jgi:hypothetical protein
MYSSTCVPGQWRRYRQLRAERLLQAGCVILEAKQGREADRAASERGEDDLYLVGQTASVRLEQGTAQRGTPCWAKEMVETE